MLHASLLEDCEDLYIVNDEYLISINEERLKKKLERVQ